MTEKELLEVITENSEIDFMCMDCLNECSDFHLKMIGEDSKYCSGVSGKEILRDILDEAISPDHAIWTIDDLENMMNPSEEKTK
jgi:hypothetical protein